MSESAYLQLYRKIRQEIIDGYKPWGSKLPSRRICALENGVSETTVLHAYEILCDEGYLASRDRSGYYVCYREREMAVPTEMPAPPPAALQSANAGAESLPFPTYARAMRRVLAQYGPELMVRSPNSGCRALRGALAEYLAAERGIRVPPECIIIGSGAEYLYSLIVQLLGRDRPFALEDPSYHKIRQVYEANGAVCELLPLDQSGVRPDALAASRAGVLHVTPFRSYPSQVTASASRRRAYVQWAMDRDGWVVEDDFDSEFSPSSKAEDTVFSLAPQGRVIYVGTFSRTVAPSIRVGYMVLPETLTLPFRRKVGFYSCTVPVTEQYLLAELIRSGEYTRHINRIRRRRRQNRETREETE